MVPMMNFVGVKFKYASHVLNLTKLRVYKEHDLTKRLSSIDARLFLTLNGNYFEIYERIALIGKI